MKKLLLFLLFVLAFTLNAEAQNPKTTNLTAANSNTVILLNMGCEGTNCVGLTIDATVGGIALTAAKYSPTVANQPPAYSNSQRADCYNTGSKIWVTDNATLTLASGRGRAIYDGQFFSIYGIDSIQNFKAIRDSSTSSTLYCDYYRQR